MENTNEIVPAILTDEEIGKIFRPIVEKIYSESLTVQTSQPIEAQTQKTLGMDNDDEDYD
jgi:hypothetical protein